MRQAREEAGVQLEAAAQELEWSRAKMYRLESGKTPVRVVDVKAMCALYGASTEVTEVLTGLARETKARGWYHAYGEVIPRWFELYVGLEAAAARLRTYESALGAGAAPDVGVRESNHPHPTGGDRGRGGAGGGAAVGAATPAHPQAPGSARP